MDVGCSIGIFLNSANLICRSADISKCFRGSLQLLDNESRLYIFFSYLFLTAYVFYVLRIIWAMATFLPFFWPWENYLGHGIFSWAMARKVAMGEKMLPMGKMVKC